MKPEFSKGDYIVVEKCDPATLQVGDIVTYHTIIDGYKAINTHKIVNIFNNDGMIQYQTQGTNKETNPEPDEILLAPGDVIGKYNGTVIPVLGSVMDFLTTQLGFFLVILLPVLIFTIYQIYKLISVVMYNKKVDMINAVNENATDEVKEAIIAEYLAKQKKEEVAQEDSKD
jgi:signal peptidase